MITHSGSWKLLGGVSGPCLDLSDGLFNVSSASGDGRLLTSHPFVRSPVKHLLDPSCREPWGIQTED